MNTPYREQPPAKFVQLTAVEWSDAYWLVALDSDGHVWRYRRSRRPSSASAEIVAGWVKLENDDVRF